MTLEAARILRRRKLEFDAWLVYEAGKTWPEAEADVSEAIDFCEYYAREMQRLAGPQPVVQLPGEHDEMIYIPLGVGVVIPPWNFPAGHPGRHDHGLAGDRQHGGPEAIQRNPDHRRQVRRSAARSRLPRAFVHPAHRQRRGGGRRAGEHPKTRFISFTGSRDVGLRINELAAKTQPGQIWIKRVIAEMGGKDAIVVDGDADLDKAVDGVLASAFGYQGQKCSACSRAIVDAKVYDEFLEKLAQKARSIKIGPSDDPANYMGPVISAGARKTILAIHRDRQAGRPPGGRATSPCRASGYFIPPTIIADVDSEARVFQEEIFGPVLAVTKARRFRARAGAGQRFRNTASPAPSSRTIRSTCARPRERFHVGNLYFNRKCTGAMVGAHPFGGFNMSGTDSKAGGPDYLLLFLQAKSVAQRV